jgi:two-component system sensor histidine kinase KdpD
MTTQRPDPDLLLARIKNEESKLSQGKLKVFLGFAPGVGKTYTMLQEAQVKRREGTDVVVGLVETHGRLETEALLAGLEVLPRLEVEYKGIRLRDFDLDAALKRRPELLLVDELAHTNAPGIRHAKRWQDVQEILRAGINVSATLNVQHLETLNDLVAQITGIQVQETVPDAVLEMADEIELVDVSVEELLKRLEEGKVYAADMAVEAKERFFRKGNLIALREMALRRTADRVDRQMHDYRETHSISQTWPVAERLLVCVGPSPFSSRLVRATKRMADGLHADWTALYVETPTSSERREANRDRAFLALRLAEQLGAKTAAIAGQNLAGEILHYARSHSVTKIIAGKPSRRRVRDYLLGSVVDKLVWNCGDIDVYVITGDAHEPSLRPQPQGGRPIPWSGYGLAILGVALCTILARLIFPYFSAANVVMVYLLGVIVAASKLGKGPAILCSVLGVAAFDVLFVEPYYSFSVRDTEYLLTFAVMLLLGYVISDLTARVRAQAEAARKRERETAALYDLSRELVETKDALLLPEIAARHIAQMIQGATVVLLPDAEGGVRTKGGDSALVPQDGNESAVAQWVYRQGRPAGRGTDTLSGARLLFLPLKTSRSVIGVLGVEPPGASTVMNAEWLHSLEAACSHVASAIEHERLSREVQLSQM